MILLFPVPELRLISVEDAGVPNRERVVLESNEGVNLGRFALVVAVRQNQAANLVPDLFFWLGEREVPAAKRINVYTGPTPAATLLDYGKPDLNLYWGRDYTIFTDSSLVPVLLRMGSGIVGTQAAAKPEAPPPTETAKDILARLLLGSAKKSL